MRMPQSLASAGSAVMIPNHALYTDAPALSRPLQREWRQVLQSNTITD
jgi:1-acyl-sn-glycerol-3-phosphate acyltransferase